jgi:hypothetical protein
LATGGNSEIMEKLLWDGKIPIEFNIFQSDIASIATPDPLFILGSRYSYLLAVASEVVDIFRLCAIELTSDVWFSSGGTPLRPNLPIGVLFDLHYSKAAEAALTPWVVFVHFQRFPIGTIVSCPSEDACAKLYTHSLKQALFLLHGSTRQYNSLSVESQSLLWESTRSGSYDLWQPISEELTPSPDCLKVIPIRMIFSDCRPTVQKPFLLSGPVVTLGDAINELLTHSFPPKRKAAASIDSTLEAGAPPNPLSVSLDHDSISKVFLHGIESVPRGAKLYDVWRLFCHADLFLYICVVL